MGTTKTATPSEVWAAIGELTKAQQRTEEAQQRTEEAQQRTEEARREGERVLREAQQKTQESLQDLTAKLNQADGNFNRKWGQFLENLVKGDLVKLLAERNIEVHRVQPRLIIPGKKGKDIGDFDLVAINGEEIVVIEVKSTLTIEEVQKFMKHLKKFKEYFSEYSDKVIYGAVAYLCESEDKEVQGAAKYSEENGLFVIVSPGGQSNVSTISNPKDFKPKVF